ncbi:MAG: nucleoside-diphosphate kinase [Bacillota bacterium]|nr:nucleoside-diphosphate kinase [Bacillota bacterium]
MERERTFLMVKPDGVQRGLIGEVIGRLEKKGLKPVAIKLMRIGHSLAEKHYGEHKGKPFYDGLVSFITSGPVVAMIWEGDNAIEITRTLMGSTDPKSALPGTIRGDLAVYTGKNIVHGSDSQKSAEREINLFFSKEEIYQYKIAQESCLYE